MLLVQADGGLGSILFPIKQPKKLPVIFPIPPSIADMHEAFILDFTRDLAKRRESIGRRWTFRPKLFLFRKPERTDPGENFQPWQKEPAHCCHQTPDPVAGNEINGKESGGENAERARFLCIRILKTAQTDTEHGHAECKKDAEKHQSARD